MRAPVVAFASGLLFAVGLGIAGMTDPARIISFLDVTGHWDPTLAWVMAGALAVYVGPAQWALRARRPLAARSFDLPRAGDVDVRLLVGAALFGVGWGTAGYCPGPAIVDSVVFSARNLVFVAAMVGAVALFHLRSMRARRGSTPPRESVLPVRGAYPRASIEDSAGGHTPPTRMRG